MKCFDVLKIKFKLWWADIDDCERTERKLIILMRKNWLIRLCCFQQNCLTSSEVDYEIMMSRSWWLRKNWKKVDNIDAKELTELTLQVSTEIQKSLLESLNSIFPALVINYLCEGFAAGVDKISRLLLKRINYTFSCSVISYSCKDFAAVIDKIRIFIIKMLQIYSFLQW